MGEGAIVRHDDEAFSRKIKPTNRMDTWFGWDQVNNGWTIVGVADAADDALGFVDEIVDETRSNTDGNAVNLDTVSVGANTTAQHRGGIVHAYPTLSDHLFAYASAAPTVGS
jgi:DNA polymerase III alpha subunit (gram-positive type)